MTIISYWIGLSLDRGGNVPPLAVTPRWCQKTLFWGCGAPSVSSSAPAACGVRRWPEWGADSPDPQSCPTFPHDCLGQLLWTHLSDRMFQENTAEAVSEVRCVTTAWKHQMHSAYQCVTSYLLFFLFLDDFKKKETELVPSSVASSWSSASFGDEVCCTMQSRVSWLLLFPTCSFTSLPTQNYFLIPIYLRKLQLIHEKLAPEQKPYLCCNFAIFSLMLGMKNSFFVSRTTMMGSQKKTS